MAIADFDAYRAMQASPFLRLVSPKASFTSRPGLPASSWTTVPESGVAPTTAVACDKTIKGALGTLATGEPALPDGTGLRVLSALTDSSSATARGGALMLVDRLSHQGGLSAATGGAQTTNLPTAALTRYTSGVGVMMALEVYGQLGATLTTFTVSYTNTDGTPGRTSPATAIGNTNNREAMRLIQIPLQGGDVGVQSVESVTLAATTGTAGTLGVTLYKPLFVVPFGAVDPLSIDMLFNLGQLPEIDQDACLSWVAIPPTVTPTTGTYAYQLDFAET